MQFYIFLQSLITFIIFFFITFLYGQFFLDINKKIFIDFKSKSIDFLKPSLGFSIIIILSYFLYFNLNLNLKNIIFFFIVISLILILFTEKKKLILGFYKVSKFSIPVFLVFIIFALINGEQFYIFRGNYWDNMSYISTALLINDFLYSELLEIRKLNIFLYEHALSTNKEINTILHNGTKNIFVRPISKVILSIFFYFKINNVFFSNYFFKVFLIVHIFCSFYFMISQFRVSKKYFISIIFIFSFWTMYVFEIDAQSQLGSIIFFLALIGILNHQNMKSIFLNKSNIHIFLLLCVGLFIFYPEFYLIFTLFFIIFVLLHSNTLKIINNEKKKFFYLLVLFLIFTLPTYYTNYLSLFVRTKFAFDLAKNWWGYYALFLTGDTIELITQHNIQIIKSYFKESNLIINLFPVIKNLFIENGFYLVPLNIIPSLSGLYFLTVGKITNSFDYLYLFLTIFLNLYIILIFKNNIVKIFDKSNKINLIFLSFFLIFLVLSLILISIGNYWILIKLYFFIGPIIFLFFAIRLTNNNKELSLNSLFLILLIIFPFYKFSTFNYGIGRYDNFPSIINPTYKKNIVWDFEKKDILECKSINFTSNDKIIDGYIAIKFYDLGFQYNGKNIYKASKNGLKDSKNSLCELRLINSKFRLKNE
jgi:hypothetical protein